MRNRVKPDERFMRLAVKEARKNIKAMDGGPFGACIVKGARVLAVARNTVLKRDATCHAEVNAIRMASRKIKSFDLSGCAVYSTNEPCPMCFSAIHWARIGAVIYGTGIKDAARIGFNELNIPDEKIMALGKIRVKIVPGFLIEECGTLLKDWDNLEKKKLY
jgi:guanine deaminase